MYWYISFLRPPPVSVPVSAGQITITPQIANDLRTELNYDPTGIEYIWHRTLPPSKAIGYRKQLTTWSPPESTYRPVCVPLPESATPGEEWRLGLFSSGSASRNDIEIFSGDHPEVLGVWSEGIKLVRGEPSFSGGPVRGVGVGESSKVSKTKGKGKDFKEGKERKGKDDDGPKQGRISREWSAGGGTLRVIEQTSFDLDKKIWDSGLALSSWIWRYRDSDTVHRSDKAEGILKLLRGPTTGKLKVVELGSGTGLVSIALAAALRSRLVLVEAIDIIATDLDSAIELMEENIASNRRHALSTGAPDAVSDSQTVAARVLDWDQPLPDWVAHELWPNLIIAADVTYNTSSFPALLSTLTALLKPPSSAEADWPDLLLAYKQRDESERELWALLGDAGISMTKIDEIAGHGPEAVEIWVGSART